LQQVLQKPRVISTEALHQMVRGEAEKSALKADLSTRPPQADSVEVTMKAIAYIG
jgi:hypothetical protein